LRKFAKCWESVQNVDKLCKMLRKCAKCWKIVQNVKEVWESVLIACEKIVVCFWSIFLGGGGVKVSLSTAEPLSKIAWDLT